MSSKSEEFFANANTLLDQLRAQKQEMDKVLSTSEEARKTADSHASYAHQAKVNTEEHSKAVSALRGQAEADVASIAGHKQRADEQAAALSAARGNAEAELKITSEKKRDAESAIAEMQNVAAAANSSLQEIEQTKIKVGEQLRAILDADAKSTQSSTAINAIRSNLDSLQSKAIEASALIAQNQQACSTGATEIANLLLTSNADRKALADVVQHLTESHSIAQSYETKLETIAKDIEGLKIQIETLLPGATSAGLATAFNAQKKRFMTPETRWFWTFIICIFLLLLISIPSFWKAAVSGVASTWSEIFQALAMRIPVLGPLVWLAIYAGRNYMLAIRLGEDYAFKEAISTAFEGYRREMKNVGAEAEGTPLNTLCQNVLRALAERPGRIYEGKQSGHSPLETAAEAAAFRDREVS